MKFQTALFMLERVCDLKISGGGPEWIAMPSVMFTCDGAPGPPGATFGGLHEHRHAGVSNDCLPAQIVGAPKVFQDAQGRLKAKLE